MAMEIEKAKQEIGKVKMTKRKPLCEIGKDKNLKNDRRADGIVELGRKLKRMHIETVTADDDYDDGDESIEEIEAAFRRSSFMSVPIINPRIKAATEDRGFYPQRTTQVVKKRARIELKHGFCVLPSAKKPAFLCSFLEKARKVVVFFSTEQAVNFFGELLSRLNIKCYRVCQYRDYQEDIDSFYKAREGVLLCEDHVVDTCRFPGVQFILQYDPLVGPERYIKVRQAYGNTLVLLDHEETELISGLKAARVHLKESIFEDDEKWGIRQSHLEKLVADNDSLSNLARMAYWDYLKTYKFHPNKEDIFNYLELNLRAVAASFCLSEAPLVFSKTKEEKGPRVNF